MLWKFTHLNKHGHFRSRIIHTEVALALKKGFGPVTFANRFYYESRSPQFGFVTIQGKKYLTPDWVEVLPETTFSDVRPAAIYQEPVAPTTWEFKSESSDSIYTVRQSGLKLTCNCPGVWRAKDRKCKHIKQVENDNK